MPMLRGQPPTFWTIAAGSRAERSPGPQTREDGAAQRPSLGESQAQAVASAIRVVTFWTAAALPVLSISAHVFGVISIDRAALFLVLPMALVAGILALGRSAEATLFRRGVLAGLVAVTLYDSTRMPFVLSGIWPDFIPDVGGWVIASDEPNAFLGYFWRYLGNGGGMAAFFVLACAVLGLRRHLVPLAVGYGVFVWSGLMGTVLLSANGESLLFEITPLSFTLSLIGHLVYGAVLGLLYDRMIRRDPDLTSLPAGDLPLIAQLRKTRLIQLFAQPSQDMEKDTHVSAFQNEAADRSGHGAGR